MKEKLYLLIVIALLATMTAACGAPAATEAPPAATEAPAEPPSPEEVSGKVTVWYDSGAAWNEAIAELNAAFAEMYPNVEVEWVTQDAAQLSAKLASRSASRRMVAKQSAPSSTTAAAEAPGRVVIAGYGRVGQNVAQGLQDAEIPYIVIDIDPERVSEARASGRPRIYGDAANFHVLSKADLGRATALVITYPDPVAVATTTKVALSINPELKILARVHRLKEAEALKELGVTELVSPEYEASFRFIKRLFNITGLDKTERRRLLALVRKDEEIAEFNPDQSV